jgi:putative colanic acid biosynthesis acetyltransferase WcaF
MWEQQQKSRVNLGGFNSTAGLERGAGKLKEISWYIIKMIFFLSAMPYPNALKKLLLQWFGAKIGKEVVIKPRVNIHFPWKLIVGNNVWIGEEVFLLNFELLNIGDNVCISQRAFLCGGNHDFRVPEMPYRNGPITLMDGCWIGASVFISPGVTIGTDSVITAGSIVTGSLEPNGIYKGNPLVYIKSRWK